MVIAYSPHLSLSLTVDTVDTFDTFVTVDTVDTFDTVHTVNKRRICVFFLQYNLVYVVVASCSCKHSFLTTFVLN